MTAFKYFFSANFFFSHYHFFLSRDQQRHKHGLTLEGPYHFAEMAVHSKKGASAKTEKKVTCFHTTEIYNIKSGFTDNFR